MREALVAHTAVHLALLRRNRVFHACLALVVIGFSVSVVIGGATYDVVSRFEILKQLAMQLHGAVSLLTAVLGIAALTAQRRTRSIALVATSAAPFESWVASLFVMPALVGIIMHAASALAVWALSFLWNVSYQTGFLYLALDRFAESLVALAFVTALGAALPLGVLWLVLVLLMSDASLLAMRLTLGFAPAGLLRETWQWMLTGVYYVIPAFDPFGEHTRRLMRSMRVSTSDWRYLAGTAAYALLATAFGYAATLAALGRRRLL